ncbi:MAG: hypothetical protein GY928_30790 [Colwellia sp.]|nr:hypothetical protein [Colwellia sp.]
MMDFYCNLKWQAINSLYLSIIGLFLLCLPKALGFLMPKYLMWPIIIYSVYFSSIFILTFVNRKLKYISTDNVFLKLFVGPIWARKELVFEWDSFKSASVLVQNVQKNMVRSMWGNYFAINERKILALEFEEKSMKSLEEKLSIIRRDHFLDFPLEVNTDSTKLLITEEPKEGFGLLVKVIIEHINK